MALANVEAASVGEGCSAIFRHVERELTYLFRFRTSVRNLQTKVEQLTARRNDVIRLEEVATRNDEIILDAVTKWLENVEKVVVEVNELTDEAALIMCSWHKGWFCSRFKLGRKAHKKIDVVLELLDEWREFGDRVSGPRRRYVSNLAINTDVENFASRVDILERVIVWLKEDTVSLVGVYGMAGVGKSTLMSGLVDRARAEKFFNEVVKVQIGQDPQVKKVQDDLAKKLGLKFSDDDILSREERLSQRLQQENQKTLIILDDLWERIEFSEIGIPCGGGYKNCKVVFTTRDEDVCNFMNTRTARIQLQVLSAKNSRALFRKNAGDVMDTPKIKGIADELLRKCGGLPLAIVTLGSALYGKDKETWINARRKLQQLRGFPFVHSCIKLSYDYIRSEEEKMCLLFCCMFSPGFSLREDGLFAYMVGENLLDNVENLSEARSSLHSVIGRLISACLLLKAESGYIRMHDLVREVAISIASKEDKKFIVKAGMELRDWNTLQLDDCKRLSLMRTRLGCSVPSQIKARCLLTLSLIGNKGLTELPFGFFEEMTGLMTLDLSNTGITVLPNSIDCLVNLRTLRLEGCDVIDVLLSNKLGRLQILNLRGSKIKRLHVSAEKLDLKLLDLSYTRVLEHVGPKVISSCPKLEELLALNIFYPLWIPRSSKGGQASFVDVTSLSHLRSLELYVEDQECLFQTIPFWEKLERFKLVVGVVKKYSLVGIAGEEMQSNSMYLQLATLSSVANWVKVLLAKTEFLHLDGSMRFGEGWSSDGMFCQLRELTISGNKSEKLITSFDLLVRNARHLEKLVVSDCPVLESLIDIPSVLSFQQSSVLPNLKNLQVWNCSNMMYLSNTGGVPGMLQLEELYISQCFSMKTIISDVYHGSHSRLTGKDEILPKLKVLSLKYLLSISSYVGDHTLAKDRYATNNSSYLGEDMGLPALEELIVEECTGLRKLPLCDIPKLRKFIADHDWFDKLIWEDEGLRYRLQHLLKYLHLDGPSPFPIPHDFLINYSDLHKILSNLRTLKVSKHGLASYIPYDLLINLQNVEKLMFHKCTDLERAIEFGQDYRESRGQASSAGASVCPSSLSSTSMSKVFPNLSFLQISNSGRLLHLFRMGEVLDIVKLERLHIKNCSSIEMVIMHEMSQVQEQLVDSSIGAGVMSSSNMGKVFRNLKFLDISGCGKLRYLFPVTVAVDLSMLEGLSIVRCSSFESIFELENVEAAEEQPPFLHTSVGVESILNDSMSNALSNLITLQVGGCDKPKYLFFMRAARGLSKLNSISISNCSSMETLIVPEKKAGAGVGHVSSICVTSASTASMIKVLPDLTYLHVLNCKNLKYLFPRIAAQDLMQLDRLTIDHCKKLEMIISGEHHGGELGQAPSFSNSDGASSSTFASISKSSMLPPSPVLTNLRILQVSGCSTLKNIFPLRVIQNMLQLQKLRIHECSCMEVIITVDNAENNHGADNNSVVLPTLRVLSLRKLPMLSSLAQQDQLADFPALEKLIIEDCGHLEKLPLASRASVPNLTKFSADPLWFNELKWENRDLELHLGHLRRMYIPFKTSPRVLKFEVV